MDKLQLTHKSNNNTARVQVRQAAAPGQSVMAEQWSSKEGSPSCTHHNKSKHFGYCVLLLDTILRTLPVIWGCRDATLLSTVVAYTCPPPLTWVNSSKEKSPTSQEHWLDLNCAQPVAQSPSPPERCQSMSQQTAATGNWGVLRKEGPIKQVHVQMTIIRGVAK